MPAASSDDARGASSAASVLAPSEGETEDPRISAYVAHLAHVGDEMAPWALLRSSSRPPSTCLCQVLFFLVRQVHFGNCVP